MSVLTRTIILGPYRTVFPKFANHPRLLMGPLSTASSTTAEIHGDWFHYFAFGSNLLKERIHVQIKGAEFLEIGLLKDFKLVFTSHGARWNGGVASVLEAPGSEVWGCVWRVPNSFAEELDIQEKNYHRLTVPIETSEGIIMCRAYQFPNADLNITKPSPHYKKVIVAGAIEHSLPEDYVKKLRGIEDNGFHGHIVMNLTAIRDINHD